MEPVADAGARAGAAQAEAVDGGQLDPFASGIGGGVHQFLDAAGLAGLGAADLHLGAQVRFIEEIVVEADDAVDIGARQIEPLGDQRLALCVDTAEFLLHVVQDRQQGSLAAVVFGDDLADLFGLAAHFFSLSACQAM